MLLFETSSFRLPTHAMIQMMRALPAIRLFFTTVHSHMISLAEADRERFYTNTAILLGVCEQILEQLGNRPMTGPLGHIYYLMEYILDVGRDLYATFSDSNPAVLHGPTYHQDHGHLRISPCRISVKFMT